MNKKFKILESLKTIRIKDFMNGTVLNHPIFTGQLNYVLFITLIMFIYITYHYDMEKRQERAAVLAKENQELRYEETTTSSQLMLLSKQSEVLRRLEDAGIDLNQMTTPPRTLKVR